MVGSSGELQGIIPNTFSHIFNNISVHNKEKRFLLRCSYLEIYNECVNDLLDYSAEKKLELKEEPQKGVYIKGLTNVIVNSIPDIESTMAKGASNRHTAETSMNKDSSRSHCIFTIYIETSETKKDGRELLKGGKLNLVDLAGSERQAKTHAEGMRLKEAAKINLSLSALGNVISALVDGKSSHIPYRDSKLTRLLQDSLGGNTKTVMIACVSPADYNYDETLSTLRYASRAKHIQNKPHINEDPKDTLLRKYENEIKERKSMLEKLAKGGMSPEQLEQISKVQSQLMAGNFEKYVEEGNDKLVKLQNEKEQIYKDKQKAEAKLKQQEENFVSEKDQRKKLELMLNGLEHKLMCGGSEFEEKQREETMKYKEMQQKLKKQMQKERRLLAERHRKEAEIELVENEYQNIQEELKDKDKIIKKLHKKYNEELSEVNDIKEEYQNEKDVLLDEIREQSQEIDFYKRLVEIVMPEKDVDKIRKKTTWDDESNSWTIPLFVMQGKQVLLPKLPKSQSNFLTNNSNGINRE